MTDFEVRVLTELSVLKAQMDTVVGGLQPGRLASLEDKVHAHELYMQRTRGFAAAFGVVLTVINIAIDAWKH
jgi:hypothetical protein